MDEIYKTAREVGYNNNKDIKFKKIKGIYIKKFISKKIFINIAQYSTKKLI